MIVMIAVNFGVVLGLVGWPVLQALGVVNKTGHRGRAAQPGKILISQLDGNRPRLE